MVFTENVKKLGFGLMRLPEKDGKIDIELSKKMVDEFIGAGFTYFDTAYVYGGGASECAAKEILTSRYDRSEYKLATKLALWLVKEPEDMQKQFETQLERTGVEYFDYYLLHNVYENSIDTYLDPKWGILPYFLEQKRLGRIRHLGFSSHAEPQTLRRFLDITGDAMEFCLIQLNYLDYTLQDAKLKYDILSERGIPVWVMEPLRGGKLAKLSPQGENALRALRPDESTAAFAFRFLQGMPGVQTVLSGMSNLEQMSDNLATFASERPLTDTERDTLFSIAESLKSSVPCTACRYCVNECPLGLDIPRFLSLLGELRYAPVTNSAMRIDNLPEEKKPSACLACGKCSAMCPQRIDIPAELRSLCETIEKIPRWAEICRQREEAQKRSK